MNSNAIVTLADSKYFELLEELINSIQSHEESKNVSICVLDAGLTKDQVSKLKKKVFSVKKAEWDIKVPGYKVLKKEWLKSQVSRAFLPKYFPNYEKYLWIDCDAWVNDWNSVELYFKACSNGKLGITQTLGPGYKIMSKVIRTYVTEAWQVDPHVEINVRGFGNVQNTFGRRTAPHFHHGWDGVLAHYVTVGNEYESDVPMTPMDTPYSG